MEYFLQIYRIDKIVKEVVLGSKYMVTCTICNNPKLPTMRSVKSYVINANQKIQHLQRNNTIAFNISTRIATKNAFANSK